MNRNAQPRNKIDVLQLKHYSSHRKTIVFFGHNEYESSMYPYSECTQKFHSPIFKNSIDAVLFIKELADKNNWNLIYKPHPIMLSLGHTPEEQLREIDIVTDVNINRPINLADITISVISQNNVRLVATRIRRSTLKDSMENEKELTWNRQMLELIQEMIHENNISQAEGIKEEKITVFEARYDAIVKTAGKEYEDTTPSDYYRGDNLYLRMVEYKHNRLLFLSNPLV